MTFKRPALSAMILAFAAVLAAFGTQAQVPARAVDCGSNSGTSGEVVRVVDGRSFVLADGREVRLAAIETLLPVPGDEDEARVAAAFAAKAALEALVLHRGVDLRVLRGSPDRYGRLFAYASIQSLAGETLVQHELVTTGQALVWAPSWRSPVALTCVMPSGTRAGVGLACGAIRIISSNGRLTPSIFLPNKGDSRWSQAW